MRQFTFWFQFCSFFLLVFSKSNQNSEHCPWGLAGLVHRFFLAPPNISSASGTPLGCWKRPRRSRLTLWTAGRFAYKHKILCCNSVLMSYISINILRIFRYLISLTPPYKSWNSSSSWRSLKSSVNFFTRSFSAFSAYIMSKEKEMKPCQTDK